MALTDPVNVMAGEQRRRALVAKLAAQMSSRGQGASTRASASVGRPFGNATDLRVGGAARLSLPFEMPVGRARPAGFDPGPPDVLQSAPPTGADAGVGIGAQVPPPPPGPAVALPAALPAPGTDPGSAPQMNAVTPGLNPADPTGFNSDTPLVQNAPSASLAPNNAPTPYQMMMARIQQLRQGRLNSMGVGV